MKRIVLSLSLALTMVVFMAVPAFAATSTDIDGIIQTAFTEAVASILRSVGVILPIALGLFGTVLAIKFALRFFKSITGKAG